MQSGLPYAITSCERDSIQSSEDTSKDFVWQAEQMTRPVWIGDRVRRYVARCDRRNGRWSHRGLGIRTCGSGAGCGRCATEHPQHVGRSLVSYLLLSLRRRQESMKGVNAENWFRGRIMRSIQCVMM